MSDIKTHTVVMPRELTAENGAKALLNGEFAEVVTLSCVTCFEFGFDDDCESCGGTGERKLSVPVSWTTIKEIYDKAVDYLAEESHGV